MERGLTHPSPSRVVQEALQELVKCWGWILRQLAWSRRRDEELTRAGGGVVRAPASLGLPLRPRTPLSSCASEGFGHLEEDEGDKAGLWRRAGQGGFAGLPSRCESFLVCIFLLVQCWQFRKGDGDMQKEAPRVTPLASPHLAQGSPCPSLYLLSEDEVSPSPIHPHLWCYGDFPAA